MPPPSDSDDAPALRHELADLRRREAWYRARTSADFSSLQHRLDALKQHADELTTHLSQRDAYIHQLHEERHATNRRHLAELQAHATEIHRLHAQHRELGAAEHAARLDAEFFVQRLRTAQAERDEARLQIQRWRSSPWWGFAKHLLRRGKAAQPESTPPTSPAAGPTAALTYYLHTSPFRRFVGSPFIFRGWVFPTDPAYQITEVRARLDEAVFAGVYGVEEPEVVRQHQLGAGRDRPGFTVEVVVSPGQHFLTLEAHVSSLGWSPLLATPIWVEAAPRS